MTCRRRIRPLLSFAAVATTLLVAPALAAADPDQPPDPDGRPADMSKPVQVFILMGQSNMVGFGKIDGGKEGTLTHAVKERGKTHAHQHPC